MTVSSAVPLEATAARILIVDDDPAVRSVLARLLDVPVFLLRLGPCPTP